jgi:hypothetical protein
MIETETEKFLKKRAMAPTASGHMANQVSKYRREVLAEEVARGGFVERGNTGYHIFGAEMGKTGVGNVTSSRSIFKSGTTVPSTASGAGASGSGGFRGSGGTINQVPEIYSPLWLNSNLNLPRDRATINAWARAFFALNPFVQNAITLHSTYPISKLNIKCKNEKILAFFEEMIEEIDLMNICIQIAQEYWLLGEAFIYAEIDESACKWSRLIIQNPDYVSVKHSVVAGEPILSLRPDENLKRIVNSNRPSDIQQRQHLNGSIIEHVRKNENIPLSNFSATHIARRLNPYDTRGTGLVTSCFRNLMLYDQLRESKFAQAANMINPLTLVKIGSEGFRPSPADLEGYREVFEHAEYDKDFKIFTHNDVTVERIGHNSGIIDINPDIEKLTSEIYIGLMVPQVLMDGGSDVTYANGGVTLDVLRQRYMSFRNMLGSFLRKKIFAPISKINDFYEYIDGEKVLVVPEVEWNHMSLFDAQDYIQVLMQLVQGTPEAPAKVSTQTLYRSLGLDWDDEVRKLRVESIQNVIHAKEVESLATMSLNELRALGPDDTIDEQVAGPLPGEEAGEGGQEGEGGMPGMGGDMGGDMGLGGLPGLDMGGGGAEMGGGDMGGGEAPPPPPEAGAAPPV